MDTNKQPNLRNMHPAVPVIAICFAVGGLIVGGTVAMNPFADADKSQSISLNSEMLVNVTSRRQTFLNVSDINCNDSTKRPRFINMNKVEDRPTDSQAVVVLSDLSQPTLMLQNDSLNNEELVDELRQVYKSDGVNIGQTVCDLVNSVAVDSNGERLWSQDVLTAATIGCTLDDQQRCQLVTVTGITVDGLPIPAYS